MSPDEQLSDDELKIRALKLIQQSWKAITEEKKKGTDVAVAEEKIIEARKAIKDKDYKRAFENAETGNAELDKALGAEPAPEPAPAPVGEAPAPEATGEVPEHGATTDTFDLGTAEAAPMPEPVAVPEPEVSAEEILAQPEEEKEPAAPKPMLFLCFNCNEPISVTVTERPLIVKCPNCGIDGQID